MIINHHLAWLTIMLTSCSGTDVWIDSRTIKHKAKVQYCRDMGYLKFVSSKPNQRRDGGRTSWRNKASRFGHTNKYVITQAGIDHLVRIGYAVRTPEGHYVAGPVTQELFYAQG